MTGAPLLQLINVSRRFRLGDQEVTALDSTSLDIRAGEFVAIVGRSGSGKSTLLNVLGCLDRPSAGEYRVRSEDTSALSSDELAALRRECFGFVFQRYNLLPHLTAIGNVELPAIYSGQRVGDRASRAQELLAMLKLGDRLDHKPNQLSGGEQQRVSIARALINSSAVILADEPTGALDHKTGAALMQVLVELNRAGHTIVIVTHDADVARYAKRVIEISDGKIDADRAQEARHDDTAEPVESGASYAAATTTTTGLAVKPRGAIWWPLFVEALKVALAAMSSHRLRTALTVLGITIGITAVVSIVALGAGFKKYLFDLQSARSANIIEVYPGKDWFDRRTAGIRPLRAGDAAALADQSFVDSVTPVVQSSLTLRYGNTDASANVSGAGSGYFQVEGTKLARGIALNDSHVSDLAQVVVIDDATRVKFFGELADPLGQTLLVGDVPCTVIGVTARRERWLFGGRGLEVVVPYSTATVRMFGQRGFDRIVVRGHASYSSAATSKGIEKVLTLRRGEKDFHTYDRDSNEKQNAQTLQAATLLLTMIAVIALVVGGIGVMNIMLVSVTERTREIGIRMAVGARQMDITLQFLIESVLVCLVGGMAGVALTVLVAQIFSLFVQEWKMLITLESIFSACLVSSAIGVVFGFVPARNAARLDPVVALARH